MYESDEKKVKYSAIIIGVGDRVNELKKTIKQKRLHNVKYAGRIDYKEIQKFYSKSKVFVLSSLGEGLPNTILEALASGCRIVSTDVGGIPEIGIEENACGKLVKPKDPASLALAITKELSKRYPSGNKKILEKFYEERIIRKYIHIYRDLHDKYIPGSFEEIYRS